MDYIRTSEEILKEFCEENMSTYTDWTGTRVETKNNCNSVEEFVNKLYSYLVDNIHRC